MYVFKELAHVIVGLADSGKSLFCNLNSKGSLEAEFPFSGISVFLSLSFGGTED
jgi:ribosome-binding ATPase YchF (GTP1/OBG family)